MQSFKAYQLPESVGFSILCLGLRPPEVRELDITLLCTGPERAPSLALCLANAFS